MYVLFLTAYFAFFNPPAQTYPIFVRRLGPWSCCNIKLSLYSYFWPNLTSIAMKITLLISPLLVANYVSAHGFVWKLGINSQTYTGNLPGATPTPSVIREITTQDPVKGASNPSLTCGQNSTAGSLVADANPGDAVTFDWRSAGLGNVSLFRPLTCPTDWECYC